MSGQSWHQNTQIEHQWTLWLTLSRIRVHLRTRPLPKGWPPITHQYSNLNRTTSKPEVQLLRARNQYVPSHAIPLQFLCAQLAACVSLQQNPSVACFEWTYATPPGCSAVLLTVAGIETILSGDLRLVEWKLPSRRVNEGIREPIDRAAYSFVALRLAAWQNPGAKALEKPVEQTRAHSVLYL